MNTFLKLTTSIAAISAFACAQAVEVRVTVTNLAPARGTLLTPVWFGFHNGQYDIYNSGEAATPGLERIAEDGTIAPIAAEFAASGYGEVDGVLNGIGKIGPGQSTSKIMNISLAGRYFSYAAMVIPSNDAFIANGNPLAFNLFDGGGNFVGANFVVMGSMVLDAGTEVNDEIPANTANFGQTVPNTGVNQNGVVGIHGGFNALGSGGILDDPMFSGADFKQPGYQVARITVEAVPEPATITLMAAGLVGLVARRRKQKNTPVV